MLVSSTIDHHPLVSRALGDPSRLLFITGPAGSGKSTLLKAVREELAGPVAVLAPSGLAALNVVGQTIHSFFGLPPIYIKKDDAKNFEPPEVCRDVRTIIIDEISMVRPDTMAAIDTIMRNAQASNLPFGGVQMIAFGDMGQLPPVIRGPEMQSLRQAYGGIYWFNADAVKNYRPRVFSLQKIHRQNEPDFLSALNAAREGRLQKEHLDLLNSRVATGRDATTLVPTNGLARNINRQRIQGLPGKPAYFLGKVSGKYQGAGSGNDLELKVGAVVCMLNNDQQGRWVNGTRGRICSIDDPFIGEQSCYVEINGEQHRVQPYRWENFEYRPGAPSEGELDKRLTGTLTQLPVRLAWAITIHRSQGMTLDRVHVDFDRGTFAHGQAYVALSRCRTLRGLTLERPIRNSDVWFDKEAFGYRGLFEELR